MRDAERTLLALSGLRRVVQRGWNFQEPEAVKQAKDAWLIQANPVPAFIDTCCIRRGKILLRDLYATYERWAEGMGITMRQQQLTVRRNLQSLGFEVIHSNKGDKVLGLSLRE